MSFRIENGKMLLKEGGKSFPFDELPEEVLNKLRKHANEDPVFSCLTKSMGISDPEEKLKFFISFDSLNNN